MNQYFTDVIAYSSELWWWAFALITTLFSLSFLTVIQWRSRDNHYSQQRFMHNQVKIEMEHWHQPFFEWFMTSAPLKLCSMKKAVLHVLSISLTHCIFCRAKSRSSTFTEEVASFDPIIPTGISSSTLFCAASWMIAVSKEAASTNLEFFLSEHCFALEQPSLTCWEAFDWIIKGNKN